MERYETYKDSGVEWIGEIPDGWAITKTLFGLCMPITDGPHETPEFHDDGIPFISAEAISCGNGRIDFEHKRGLISRDYYDECCKKYVPATGDVYMIKSGATTGRVAIVDTDQIFTIWSPLAVFRCDLDKLIPKYLFYFLQSEGYQKQVEDSWSYGTQQNIGMRTLERLLVCYPPCSEQEAIANYLDAKTAEIDALVADCEREVGLLREYRKAVISEAVTKGLDPDAPMRDSGVEWIEDIPEGWSVVPYKAIALVAANLQHPEDYPDLPQVAPDRIEKDTGRLLPCLTVDEAGVESDNHLFICGDILYSKVRPALNKVTVAPFDGMCSADMYPIRSNQNHRWLMYYMLSNAFMEQVIVSTDRVKMPKVNKEELGMFKVVLPAIAQQVEIAVFLDGKTAEIDSLIESKQQMADKLREYRKSLISEAVTGKFKVPGVK